MSDPIALEAMRLVGSKVDNLAQGLTLLSEAVGNQTLMLTKILDACTEDREPSPLVEPLKELAAGVTRQAVAIEDMTLAIRDNSDLIAAQPDAFRHAVEEVLDEREGKGE